MYNFTLRTYGKVEFKENFSSKSAQAGCDETLRLLKENGVDARGFGKLLGRRIVERPDFLTGRQGFKIAIPAGSEEAPDRDLAIELSVVTTRII